MHTCTSKCPKKPDKSTKFAFYEQQLNAWTENQSSKKSTCRTLQLAKGSVQTYIMERKRRSGWWLAIVPRTSLILFIAYVTPWHIGAEHTKGKQLNICEIWSSKGGKFLANNKKGSVDRSPFERRIQSLCRSFSFFLTEYLTIFVNTSFIFRFGLSKILGEKT